jgi:bifunctional enzyme CysN/CysC
MTSNNVFETLSKVDHDARAERNGHAGGVLWFTGLPGAGKSTLAVELERRLFAEGYQVYVLDGDNMRHGLSGDLGFSHQDRTENIRRVGEVAALFADAGYVCIAAFISPYAEDRRTARAAGGEAFHEVFVDASLEVCEKRDPKGLYKRARAGEVPDFTGVSAPYERPKTPELAVDSGASEIADCIDLLADYVVRNFGLSGGDGA